MIIGFGYVSDGVGLWECWGGKTMTFRRWKKVGKEEGEEKVYNVRKEKVMDRLGMVH
ncbi:hypothetical protein [Bacillus mycoides]|uniref:hypothetical protein n=1 Tax=Bacillus mycoides TaxID=1405 RepID=UPI0011A0A4F0|nr:hypothetical protein [Bacillus mycoides]